MPDRPGFHSLPPGVTEERRQARAAEKDREARDAEERAQTVRRYSLAIAAGLFMLAGLYFLLVAPGETVSRFGGILDRDEMRVANLHRLTLGETFTISGAILSGFAWRPKA